MTRTQMGQSWAGSLLLAMGAVVALGWAAHIPALVQIHPEFVGMAFNTALCFTLTGTALLLRPFEVRWVAGGRALLGCVVMTLAVIALTQFMFDVDLVVDFADAFRWLNDTNPRPGRMAPNTALAFILTGYVLITMDRVRSRRTALMIQCATLGVLILGLTGLFGYTLQLDLLYSWFHAAAMAAHTAVGMLVVAIGLWNEWRQADWYKARRWIREDERIAFVGTAILVTVGLTIGVGGFAAQQGGLERSLRQSLPMFVSNEIVLFKTLIRHNESSARAVASSPNLLRLTRVLAETPTDAAARTQLTVIAQTVLASGFSGLSILDRRGAGLLTVGRWAQASSIETDLHEATPTSLLWEQGLYVKRQLPLIENGEQTGSIVLEQPLPLLRERLFAQKPFGETGEMGMCFPSGEELRCFPRRNDPVGYKSARLSPGGSSTPMDFAVRGLTGVFLGRDYRGKNVIAAYGPLSTGLGLVVKQETEELYQPVREQLQWSALLLVGMVAVGAIVLRRQVAPLAASLVSSSKNASERELHIRTVVDNIAEGLVTLDERGGIQSFNAAAASIFGYSQAEGLGKNITELMPERMRPLHDGGVKRYLGGAPAKVVGKAPVEVPGLRKDGTVVQLEIVVNEMRIEGRVLFVGIVRDISERKRAELALFAEKERLRVTLGSIGDAVITTDTQGVVTYLNPVAEKMTGWSTSEATGLPLQTVFLLVHEETNSTAQNPVDVVLKTGARASLPEKTVLVGRDGTLHAIEDSAAPIHDRDGNLLGVVMVFHDVSAARAMTAQMTYQASHDPLTGLINRREFERRLESALQTGKSQAKEHTLLYLDLDQFKIVNDTCGHVAGDELLRQLTSVLLGKLRQNDTLARLGGDEFGVLLENCSTGPAIRIADVLRETIGDFRFVWVDQAFPVGVSIGLVTFSNGGITLPEVLRMADSACYMAKDKGRNRVHVYTDEDVELTQRHGEMGWVARIKRALEDERFVLYSQKILGLKDGNRHRDHREMLLRLRGEDGKMVPPMAFIPAAERYGLMPSIDRWVVKRALSTHARPKADAGSDAMCAINLSGMSICDEGFSRFVSEQLDLHAVAPSTICFEITETAAVTNLTHAAKLIRELKLLGCRFSLDDFGSGMSSFAYLKHLPVDYLKIDGGFVKDMLTDPIDYAMVEAINNIGHTMGLQTIAEFAETQAIVDALTAIGVDYAQGHAIATPAP